MVFDPKDIKTFRFVSYKFDNETSTASLNYAFDDKYFFTEEIIFNNSNKNLSDERIQALDNCLKHLHLVAGTSYYKAAIPPEIILDSYKINKNTAKFLEKLYLHGLGEFAYRNNFDLRGKIKFPISENEESKSSKLKLRRRTAVPVGGGKDSVVSIETLKNAGEDITLFSVGYPRAIKEVSEKSGLSHITVTRKLSPVLFEINKQGALNGHIPISAVIAFILAASSIIYDFDKVAMSNERSASVGNLIQDGFEVNHQYSKGLPFEVDVNEHFHNEVLENFTYFSFLRPLSELGIAKLFSKFEKYHNVFTSCNAAFRIHEDRRADRWCLNCDKCRFVFLCLAPFIKKEKMISIFGENLLDNEIHIQGYDELLGISGHKPFECVGEVEESTAAFLLLTEKSEWKDSIIVKRFSENISSQINNKEQLINQTFSFSDKHMLTKKYEEILRDSYK